MKPLPLAVHTAAQVRALDRHAIDGLHIPSYTLMTQAGEAAAVALRSCWPSKQRVTVVCGPGNNGGDGYVLARLAQAMRIDVAVVSLSDVTQLSGDAKRAHDDYVAAGGAFSPGVTAVSTMPKSSSTQSSGRACRARSMRP
jgi:NAD(P)H-hydrate epimerase